MPSFPAPPQPPPAECLHALGGRGLVYVLPAVASCVLAVEGWWVAAGVVFWGAFVVFAWGSVNPGSRLFGPLVRGLPDSGAGRGEVWLTLDDGPDPATTPALLELLDAHGARAVFFMIGEKAARHPELVWEVVLRGHVVGNHSLSHPAGWFWALGPGGVWREVASCQGVLRGILGVAPVWFRPPVGHHNIFVAPVLRALGLRMMVWSCRGYDAVLTDTGGILRRIGRGLGPGGIILLHDAVPHAPVVLAGVLELLRARGLRAVLPESGEGRSAGPSGG